MGNIKNPRILQGFRFTLECSHDSMKGLCSGSLRSSGHSLAFARGRCRSTESGSFSEIDSEPLLRLLAYHHGLATRATALRKVFIAHLVVFASHIKSFSSVELMRYWQSWSLNF
jgi:hypothetical protein